jgi:hypothetical protein
MASKMLALRKWQAGMLALRKWQAGMLALRKWQARCLPYGNGKQGCLPYGNGKQGCLPYLGEYMEFLYATNRPIDEKLRSRILDGTGRLCQRQVYDFAEQGGDAKIWIFSRKDRIAYEPDKQKWIPSGEYAGVWAGMWLDDVPAAAELKRRRMVAGFTLRLGGDEWVIPLAREITGGSRLPQVMRLGPAGSIIKETAGEYRGFEQRINQFWAALAYELGLAEIEARRLNEKEMFCLACEAIGINYRIGADEAGLLELIETDNVEEILLNCVDKPAIEIIIKQALTRKGKK